MMKNKIMFIILFVSCKFSYSTINQDNIKVKELVDYIIENQQTIYDRKEEVYTDSICVKDFNFNTFKYSEKIKFENPNGYKLYFVDNDIRKIDFNYNSENITLMILNYKNLKIAISKSIFLDVFVFDLQKGKTINLNFETKGIHKFPNELIPLDMSDLKKIIYFDNNLKPISTLYLSNLQISGLSHFIFFKEKIYEEIRIFKPSENHIYFDFEKIFLFKLYRILEHPIEVPFYEFKNYQIEIIPRYKIFFWYKDYVQKYAEIPGSKFNNKKY